MRNLIIAALAVAVLILAYRMNSQSKMLAALQKPHDAPPVVASLELQGRCAKQAAEAFKALGYSSEDMTDFTNHYSSTLGRCFIVVADTKVINKVPIVDKMLADAFESKVYGTYSWSNREGKKFWEVAPSDCTVTLPSGEEKTCTSSAEWDALAKAYMDAE
jgi:hypothetical protein